MQLVKLLENNIESCMSHQQFGDDGCCQKKQVDHKFPLQMENQLLNVLQRQHYWNPVQL
jgi:hypothetical protein